MNQHGKRSQYGAERVDGVCLSVRFDVLSNGAARERVFPVDADPWVGGSPWFAVFRVLDNIGWVHVYVQLDRIGTVAEAVEEIDQRWPVSWADFATACLLSGR